MKKLIAMLALITGCGLLQDRLATALDAVKHDEAALTALCTAAVDEAWDNSDLDRTLALCDEAYDIHDEIQRIRAELEKSPDDEALRERLFWLAFEFGRKVAALVQGLE